ncbi:hypothetical protein CIW48_22735 [Methylobacterium sp. P1-11]|uniref:hypothetical protein n=1 Tax=Methylobacterium sp. P1-11 TaxID=2024616 RepID=UPI0011ED5A1D|nr:hypothetical protein [Methylobacterium sp. P1-11]KAA0121616.1 hypothetical protein CIW48_22735 [Methylobacterium sp. P1-11]
MRDTLLTALAGACACLAGTAGAQAEPACPSRDFPAFLAAFVNDVAVQKAFVAVPLRSDTVDADAEPEPKPVSRMLTVDQMRFPLMPSTRDQAKYRLKQEVMAVTRDDMRVRLYTPDTGNQVIYAFRRGTCWTLYQIKDDSL